MVTIYDIAKETGLSAPTVSKALTGTGTISEATRKKILETAKQMGYEPNMTARTLATKKSHIIGVIYDDTGMSRGFAHPLFSVVLNRFREKLEQAGYDLLFLSRHFNMSYFVHANYRSVDGIIIINPAEYKVEYFKEFVKNKTPCVSTNSIIEGISTVITENEIGGYKAAEYLIKKGHKKLAFLSGPINKLSPAAEERFVGFKKACNDYNITFDETLYEECDYWHEEAGYESFSRLYERNKDFTAIFACSDLLAYGVIRYAQEHQIKIPEDISIMGFDDDFGSSYSWLQLTSFSHDGIKIAEEAADILLKQINGEPVPSVVRFPPEFRERNSVKDLNLR